MNKDSCGCNGNCKCGKEKTIDLILKIILKLITGKEGVVNLILGIIIGFMLGVLYMAL